MSKQTAVKWLVEKLIINEDINKESTYINMLIEQAKEMEQKQQDELAIGFSEWCLDENQIIYGDGEELLQIYKTKLKNENK
jgi:hypothetical protein